MSERKIVDYKMISVSFVIDRLTEGYFLYGTPFPCDNDICQAMVKYED